MLLAGPTSTEGVCRLAVVQTGSKWLHTQVISVEDSKHIID